MIKNFNFLFLLIFLNSSVSFSADNSNCDLKENKALTATPLASHLGYPESASEDGKHLLVPHLHNGHPELVLVNPLNTNETIHLPENFGGIFFPESEWIALIQKNQKKFEIGFYKTKDVLELKENAKPHYTEKSLSVGKEIFISNLQTSGPSLKKFRLFSLLGGNSVYFKDYEGTPFKPLSEGKQICPDKTQLLNHSFSPNGIEFVAYDSTTRFTHFYDLKSDASCTQKEKIAEGVGKIVFRADGEVVAFQGAYAHLGEAEKYVLSMPHTDSSKNKPELAPEIASDEENVSKPLFIRNDLYASRGSDGLLLLKKNPSSPSYQKGIKATVCHPPTIDSRSVDRGKQNWKSICERTSPSPSRIEWIPLAKETSQCEKVTQKQYQAFGKGNTFTLKDFTIVCKGTP